MLRNLVFWLAVIRRVVSIAALVIVVCACSEAPRMQDLAACSLEAERTYPFGNEAFMSDQSMLMQGRRSNYVKTCMEARGYNYNHYCDQLEGETKQFQMCLLFREKAGNESAREFCQKEREMGRQLNKKRVPCYEPRTVQN